MNKEPKNHLNSFDFCLRKAIALHVFSKNSDETLSEFAKAIDTTQPTLSKWMSREADRQGRITPPLKADMFQAFPKYCFHQHICPYLLLR